MKEVVIVSAVRTPIGSFGRFSTSFNFFVPPIVDDCKSGCLVQWVKGILSKSGIVFMEEETMKRG